MFGACSRDAQGYRVRRAHAGRNMQCAFTKCHGLSVLTPAPAPNAQDAQGLGYGAHTREGSRKHATCIHKMSRPERPDPCPCLHTVLCLDVWSLQPGTLRMLRAPGIVRTRGKAHASMQRASRECHALSVLTSASASTLCSAWMFGACSGKRSGCSGLGLWCAHAGRLTQTSRKCHALGFLTFAPASTLCSAWTFGACSRERSSRAERPDPCLCLHAALCLDVWSLHPGTLRFLRA